jgi:hypothetical protein
MSNLEKNIMFLENQCCVRDCQPYNYLLFWETRLLLSNGKKLLPLILPTLKWVLHVIEIKGLHKRCICIPPQKKKKRLTLKC